MKKILSLVMVIAMIAALAVTTSAASDIPTDGLIAHYKFEGNLKDEVTDKEPEELLASGGMFGESMWDFEDLTYYQCGVNGGLAFSGAEETGFATVNPGVQDFTWGIWLCLDDSVGVTPVIWYGSQNQSPENWLGIWSSKMSDGSWAHPFGPCIGSNDAGGHRYYVEPEENYYDTEAEDGVILPWTHVVSTFVYDEATETYTGTLYLNGENIGSVENLPVPGTADDAMIYVGSINAWGDKAISGFMDEFVVYNRALSDAEVASLYACYDVPERISADDMWATEVSAEGGNNEGGDATPTTDPVTEPTKDETNAPEESQKPAESGDAATTTAAPKDEGGCGSTLGAAAAIIALTSVFGCAIVKKH